MNNAADENNLDKINGVAPLDTNAKITALLGRTFCALVYDSDISVDVSDGYGSLKGATHGLIAFTVTGIGADPDGSVLPSIVVDLVDSDDVQRVCDAVAAY